MFDRSNTEDVYNKLVCSNFDGASVMSGRKADVQALIKGKKPGTVYVHCVDHSLELDVLDAINSDQFLGHFEKTLEAIFLMC